MTKSTTKLNQIIAIEKGVKSQSESTLSEVYKIIQKPELFNGFDKKYLKKDEEGEELPAEKKRVQYTVTEALNTARRSISDLIDITARKDFTNCVAKADVIVDGKTIIKDAPVSYLLFLEKQATNIRTFINTLPVLDDSEEWVKDANNSAIYISNETQTFRTKKLQKPLVLYPATAEHPAQTQLITEDVIVGIWAAVKKSGAISKNQKNELSKKADAFLKAVKEAREAANIADEIPTQNIGDAVFNYILGE